MVKTNEGLESGMPDWFMIKAHSFIVTYTENGPYYCSTCENSISRGVLSDRRQALRTWSRFQNQAVWRKFVQPLVGQKCYSPLKEGRAGIAWLSEFYKFRVERTGFDCIVKIRQDRPTFAELRRDRPDSMDGWIVSFPDEGPWTQSPPAREKRFIKTIGNHFTTSESAVSHAGKQARKQIDLGTKLTAVPDPVGHLYILFPIYCIFRHICPRFF